MLSFLQKSQNSKLVNFKVNIFSFLNAPFEKNLAWLVLIQISITKTKLNTQTDLEFHQFYYRLIDDDNEYVYFEKKKFILT